MASRNAEMVKLLQKTFELATALLSVHSKELKAVTHMNTCICMFTAPPLTTAKRQKQPKCPPTGKWERK
jgi:hypothetical protein